MLASLAMDRMPARELPRATLKSSSRSFFVGRWQRPLNEETPCWAGLSSLCWRGGWETEGMGRASAESEQDQAGVLHVLSGASCLRRGQPEVEEDKDHLIVNPWWGQGSPSVR